MIDYTRFRKESHYTEISNIKDRMFSQFERVITRFSHLETLVCVDLQFMTIEYNFPPRNYNPGLIERDEMYSFWDKENPKIDYHFEKSLERFMNKIQTLRHINFEYPPVKFPHGGLWKSTLTRN